ncbi:MULTISPECIES: hypothetical protein [unclassified Mesorhizobium]|uniref:hypothetical protein n=1 Tax=unclassified Mesorhizobium TaxID=325217 RepID=UPI000FCCDBB8|nr:MULTISPECIES: hypothetical protein [unclassified Mesorhizobium]TGV55689.1 hypothetical protein EN784_30345 [bacterium M00.F.Ca.ET.141.01.1.1]TGW06365.1 hypothetical protein EN788_42525 [Mesorhizobium sp. M2D.F.Ca.ET.145.01.1.1]RUW43659.1 hypothetical protein EOA36_33985 [Mesorhizobium sp. M8A.F.Ca.ET.021.01.1.1]RWF39074.1 MAG: hypothetical protein EOS46_31130 [Mesorhizobium sp.]TGT87174.1 hypothetical protein EN804_18940 [Mesorhizobium sp. M8A.F.Ca.ET.161.01.1.1]
MGKSLGVTAAIGLSFAFAISIVSSAHADGECAKEKSVKKQLVCLEKKIDKKETNLKIRSSSRGQCLAWVDTNKAPYTTDCTTSDSTWDLLQTK